MTVVQNRDFTCKLYSSYDCASLKAGKKQIGLLLRFTNNSTYLVISCDFLMSIYRRLSAHR